MYYLKLRRVRNQLISRSLSGREKDCRCHLLEKPKSADKMPQSIHLEPANTSDEAMTSEQQVTLPPPAQAHPA